jgi:DNA/RNA-binding domain of Phe-tRNA-synthetase-like protein
MNLDGSVKARLPGVRFAWTVYEDVRITPATAALAQELLDEQTKAKQTLTIESVAQDAGVAESRRAFRTLGLDPARYRPSQEALLRRVLKDQPITLINSGVDVCNLLSVRFRVPMGLYDAAKIEGALFVKVGSSSDIYAALNGRDIECSDKLILCDAQGTIGSPYVDSRRTAVDESCRRCLHVIYFCPAGLGEREFHAMMETVKSHIGGSAQPYQWIA